MAIKLADAFVNIGTRDDDLKRGFASARKAATSFGNIMQGIMQGVGQQIFRSVAGGVRQAVTEIGKAVNAASDLSESMTKTAVVFGDSAQGVLEWSKTSATALGQSQQAALEAASTFGNLFTSMGVGRGEAAELSKEFVQLASDLASFNNVSPEEALTALRSGILGEIEPLRRFGISLNAATVEAQALKMGLAATKEELTEQDKILARYELIMRQTANAQGDFARNSEGLANQQRIFAANMQDAAATLGQAFEPVVATVLRHLNDLITRIRPYGENIINSLASGLADGVIAITPILMRLRQLFTYWLRPGSPPRLLPDLDKWGRAAMNEYLRGWGEADLSIFDELANSLETVIRSFAGAGKIGEADLVTRVFGTRDAIARAISEFQRAGSVSQSTLRSIERAAGPAGSSVRGLVSAYFDLQSASRAAARAQAELTRITEAYDAALSPINDKLRAVQSQQADIRDQQRAAELNAQIADATTAASDRRLAQLELEEIELRRQQRLLEDERDTAVSAAEDKLDAARKEEQAKQSAYNRQQALLSQQVDANRLIEEERNLRQRLADEALAAQERALRELEAAQREMEQAEKQRAAELERIYDAQLAYNLQLADTPGKIAILKQELGRYAEGSAEYYRILTQIAALEQQLAREREAGAGGGLAAGLEPLEAAIGEGGVLTEGLEGVNKLTEALDALFEALEETDPEELTGFWLDMMVAIEDLTASMNGFLQYLGLFFGDVEGKAQESGDAIEELQKVQQARVLSYIRLFAALFKGDWGAMWDEIVLQTQLEGEENRLAFDTALTGANVTMGERLAEASVAFGQWLADRAQAISDWGATLKTAAGEAIQQFFAGIQEKWRELEASTWVQNLKSFRDYLPFSEPRNPASPLAGLGKSGEAIVGQIQAGLERASLNIAPVAAPLTAAAAGPVTNVFFDQVFQTTPDWGLTRAASRDGVLAAMRVRGG